MNNADLIVAILKAAGIERGFGVPSGNVLPLMEAMRVGGIDFVLTAHEGSAGFAADVTAPAAGGRVTDGSEKCRAKSAKELIAPDFSLFAFRFSLCTREIWLKPES